MGIPTSQLQTWSSQGSITQSQQTYATVKNALESTTAPYADRNFKVFLQGSYWNDTNIYAESDVDVVIRQDGAYYYDIGQLPADQQTAFKAHLSGPGNYPYDSFKAHVKAALENAFGNAVHSGAKAIQIDPGGARRSADVIVAFEHRRYHRFNSIWDESHTNGITFFSSDRKQIDNFPERHSQNLTAKHQATGNRLKPTIRIFKNMRSKLVADRVIGQGVAPSYYIEGLLYNVPDADFVYDENQRVFNILKWLAETSDRSTFVCANEMYYLLRDNSSVCWPVNDGATFINAAIGLWNNW